MNSPKIERISNLKRGKLKQSSVRLNVVNKLVDKSKSELSLERLPIRLGRTKEEINQDHTPGQWFSDWIVDGEEKGMIKYSQSEVNNNQYDRSNEPAFFFY